MTFECHDGPDHKDYGHYEQSKIESNRHVYESLNSSITNGHVQFNMQLTEVLLKR